MGDKSFALIFWFMSCLIVLVMISKFFFCFFSPTLSIDQEALRHRMGFRLQCWQGEGKWKILGDLLGMEEQKGDTGTESILRHSYSLLRKVSV